MLGRQKQQKSERVRPAGPRQLARHSGRAGSTPGKTEAGKWGGTSEGQSQAWLFAVHLPRASLAGLGAGGSGLGAREWAT